MDRAAERVASSPDGRMWARTSAVPERQLVSLHGLALVRRFRRRCHHVASQTILYTRACFFASCSRCQIKRKDVEHHRLHECGYRTVTCEVRERTRVPCGLPLRSTRDAESDGDVETNLPQVPAPVRHPTITILTTPSRRARQKWCFTKQVSTAKSLDFWSCD